MSSVKKLFGLGKGLESLIPPGGEKETKKKKEKVEVPKPKTEEGVYYLETSKIKPNPHQPRRNFDKEGISELALSVKRYGILQPLLVTKIQSSNPKGVSVEYQLIAGERRLRAAKISGLNQVPVIVKDYVDKDKEQLEIALIENIQREDLNAIEEAEAYTKLQDEFGLSHSEIAKKVSKNRATVTNAIRLNNLPEYIKMSVREGKVTNTQARTLLSFKDGKEQKNAYEQLVSGGLVVRDLETMSRKSKSATPKKPVENPKFKELEKNLGSFLETHVKIQTAGMRGGKVMIKFGTLEELNRIAKGILD
jgi:ParB family chromosome partitioning protein